MEIKTNNGFSYNPILESKLSSLKFDYVAMGHIHKTNFSQNSKIIYSGSPISFGFDETGEHGMIVGEITKEKLKVEFIKLDERQFIKQEMSVDEIANQEELIEEISNLKLNKNDMYEIILVGNRQFDIDTLKIIKLIEPENILKIKNHTQMSYDIEKISKENNLRGIFVREVIKQYQNKNYTEEQIQKAIEIGLQIMLPS